MQSSKYKVKRPLRTMPGNVTVYEAEQTALRRKVEIRVLNQFVGKDSDTYLRFEREFKTIARLDHPHVVKIFDWGLADDKIYYVAERRPAAAIDELIEADQPPSMAEAFLLGAQIGDALQYLHDQDLIHRDIGPASVYWAPKKRNAFIAHFTMVKNLNLEELTAKGVGHVAPLAFTPEQSSGGEISRQTDIFLLGALVYRLVTGREPIPPEHVLGNPGAAFDIAAPSLLVEDLEPQVDQLLLRALATDPSERYATAKEFGAELKAYQERLESKRSGLSSRAMMRPKAAAEAPTPAAAPTADPKQALDAASVQAPAPAAPSAGGPGEELLLKLGLGPLVDQLGATGVWGLFAGLGLILVLVVGIFL